MMRESTRIRLSDHFTYGKLFRFTLPSVAMMVFSSIYGVVDGFFVSNCAGKTPFAAVNLVMPVLAIMGTVSFMFGTGGTALIAKTYGEDGVSAYGVMMYASMIFTAAFGGYTMGIAPAISYHYGANDYPELKSLLRKSLCLCYIAGASMVIFGELLCVPIADIFVSYDSGLRSLTISGFRIFALSFVFIGFGIFSSGFFTALNDGVTSAIISFVRTMIFECAAVMLLPLVWGINGVWSSVIVSEFFAVLLSVMFLITKQKKYQY